MSDSSTRFEELFSWLEIDALPSAQQILDSMDMFAWMLVLLLLGAGMLGLFLTINTRYQFRMIQEAEATPDMLLARLKQDPTYLTPMSIVNRLGADVTLQLLEYGDQVTGSQWRFKWSAVREELLKILAAQNAFGPIYALAHYYQCVDNTEPDSLRIRRTALIHKLGQGRYLDPGPDGMPAQLRLVRHAAEQIGELDFDGPTIWLENAEEPMPTEGPIIKMEVVRFKTVDQAEVRLLIQRTPSVGGGFLLQLEKRHKMWIVTNEQIDWVL